FAQAVRFRLERLSFCFQAADFTGSEGFQRLSDCRQLGSLTMVLLPFLILFRSVPVKFAAKLFELGLDRVALRLHRVAIFPQRAHLRDDPIALPTERLVFGSDCRQLGSPPMVLLPFLILFRSVPVKFAAKLLELGLDRVALRLHRVAVFPQRAHLRDDSIALPTERLVFGSDCCQLGSPPMVLLPFLILFRSVPVKFAAKLFELGLDRVALRLHRVAVFPQRAHLRDDPIALPTERLVFGFQDANIVGRQCTQSFSDRRVLGTEPLVLRQVVIVFRPEPVKFAAKLFELGLDRVALRLHRVAVFPQRAHLRDDSIALPTERLVFGSDCRQLGSPPMVLFPFLILFRSVPVKFAAKLFELGLDRVALRLHRVAVFPQRAHLRDDPIALPTERLVFGFQDANIVGRQCTQSFSDRRVLGTEPLVLRQVVVTFRPEPVEFAAKLFELGLDRVALRLHRVAIFPQRAHLRDDPIALPTERLVFGSDCRQLGSPPMVLLPFLILFRSVPVKFAAKLLELGLDRVALRLHRVAVFPQRAHLRDDSIALPTERLVFGSDCCQLGSPPMVLLPFLILFRSVPVKFAAKLFELGLHRVALRLHRVAVFPQRAHLRDDSIALPTERLVFGSDCCQLGTPPMVLLPFLILFRSVPVKFAAKLFELGLDRVALRLHRVAVFPQRAHLRDDSIALPTERLVFGFQDANIVGRQCTQSRSDCRELGSPPMVFLPFLILFRPEPVKFAATLFELGLDRVALRLHRVAVFPQRAHLRDDPIALPTERLVFGFQDANIVGRRCTQSFSDCCQLGTLPMVLLPFLILFRPEPVKFAAKLFELGLDRVALRLHRVAVFPQRAQLRDDSIALPTERLVFGFQDANIVGRQCTQSFSDRRVLGTEPLVLRQVVVTFRPEPVKFAAKLFELGLDRVALRLHRVAVFPQRAHLRDDPIALPTERLVFGFQDANI